MVELGIKISGVILFCFGVFHIFFDKIFAWKSDFDKLSLVNAKVLYTIHIFLIPFFFFMSWMSLKFTDEMAHAQGLGGAITGFCSLFWLARGVWQFFYFDPSKAKVSRIMLAAHYLVMILSLVLAYCYGAPFLK
jgi:hypothetical protein